MKNYNDMMKLDSFEKRLEYLKLLDNNIKSPRHMSMPFYKSNIWDFIRKQVIDRDLGFDLGVFGVYIEGPMLVHHIQPIDENDIIYQTPKLLDLNNLITTSKHTHNIIHYNTKEREEWIERKPGDTKLW